MHPRIHIAFVVAVVALAAPLTLAARTDGAGSAPPIPAKVAAPLVPWRELSDHPGRYTNKRLRLVLQFHARVPTWNPYLTRFGTRDFDAFQFWSDEQRLWSIADFQAPPVRLFARRESLSAATLEQARQYSRFEIEITVREIFCDQPWAEIESVLPLAEHVSEGTLIHASRAIELFQSESWKLAQNEFDQALIGSLPADAKQELERMREECLRKADPRARAIPKPASLFRSKPASPRTDG